MDYDANSDGQMSDSDAVDADAENEAALVAASLQLHEPVSISPQPGEVKEQRPLDIGADSFPGDEGIEYLLFYFANAQ